MTLARLTVTYSERLYNALLSLYPLPFRVRFAPEMMQLFRDCCRDALEKGEVAVLSAFWVSSLRDLVLSVLRERQRQLLGPVDSSHPLIGIIDLLLIPSMVVANLLVLGPILTLLVKGGAYLPMDRFAVISGFFSLVVGGLAVIASIVITKLRPTVRLWVKLSA
jgi:hypothetical protein